MGASLPSLRLAGASLTLYFIPSSFRGADQSNLLGNVGQPFEVSFAVPPTVLDTTGVLDLNGG
ncbi:hypothetical protein GCM10010842_33600 [Deinococcus daejeonensis]|uniref:Uncharacterized protein n=1 Tax=Deinococcus daejeonensis TaxID=1007098 RepID=A0ABQ2JGM6_9DEIO|nr:hypothetical protein GCM10010842_33600 [Deinococcus daejeonensis]